MILNQQLSCSLTTRPVPIGSCAKLSSGYFRVVTEASGFTKPPVRTQPSPAIKGSICLPNDPLPIFLPILYFPPTRRSIGVVTCSGEERVAGWEVDAQTREG